MLRRSKLGLDFLRFFEVFGIDKSTVFGSRTEDPSTRCACSGQADDRKRWTVRSWVCQRAEMVSENLFWKISMSFLLFV